MVGSIYFILIIMKMKGEIYLDIYYPRDVKSSSKQWCLESNLSHIRIKNERLFEKRDYLSDR